MSEIAGSPSLYPILLDRERREAELVEMTRDTYRASTFLDKRTVTAGTRRRRCDLRGLLADPPLPRPGDPPVHYVLHTGFCCSTLLGRALDQIPSVFCLREPFPLAQVAAWAKRERAEAAPADGWRLSEELGSWLKVVHFLLRRSYAGVVCNVVKPIPRCSILAPWLLDIEPRSRVLFLCTDPVSFLVSTLRRSERRKWAQRLLRAVHPQPMSAPSSDVEAAAMLWATLVEHYRSLRRGPHAARVHMLDGGRLASEREAALRAALAALGIPQEEAMLAAVLAHPLWQTYSKQPGRDYDAYARQEIVERARLRHHREIAEGLRWLAANVEWFAEERPVFGA